MNTNRLLAPLVLLGIIAVALYIYAKPRPLWTTSSPKVQGGIEFLGVYRGTPKHFAKFRLGGFGHPYSGGLWAYFRANRKFGRLYSAIEGTAGVLSDSTGMSRQSIPGPGETTVVVAVPVPSEYPNELVNGSLVLSDGTKRLGTWKLKGMPPTKLRISPSEPDKVCNTVSGHRLQIDTPIVQTIRKYHGPILGFGTLWSTELRVTTNKLDPRDKFEYGGGLSRTVYRVNPVPDYGGIELPANGTIALVGVCGGSVPSKRVEFALKIRRFRMAPDSITIHDAVLSKDPSGSYLITGCSDSPIRSKQGLSFELWPSLIGAGRGKGWYGLGLISHDPLGKKVLANSLLSKTLKLPINLDFGKETTSIEDNTWTFAIRHRLTQNVSGQTVKLKSLTLAFQHKAKLEEKTVYFLGPTK